MPDLMAVAKRPDRAFLSDERVIDLTDQDGTSLLLRKIRDEVHRFVIGFHRKLRDRRLQESSLEQIPGIGRQRRLELLRTFGSIDAIRKATVDEVASVKGFSTNLAERILKGVRKHED
jgi:excinuclease ABC subunit C